MEMPLAGFPPSAHVPTRTRRSPKPTRPRCACSGWNTSPLIRRWPASPAYGNRAPRRPLRISPPSPLFCARDQPARAHPHWGDRLLMGRHADRFLDQPGWTPSDASLMPAFAARAHFADKQTHLSLIESAEKRADAEAAAHHLPTPRHPWHPDPASWIPAGLYNGMVAPLTPYAIKGFLWYQGETDSASDRATLYAKLLPSLIADWRRQGGQGNLPFLLVQISSFDSPGENWGIIRDSQRRSFMWPIRGWPSPWTLDSATTCTRQTSKPPARALHWLAGRWPTEKRASNSVGRFTARPRGKGGPGNLVRPRGRSTQQQGRSQRL